MSRCLSVCLLIFLCGSLIPESAFGQDRNISGPWQFILRQPDENWMLPDFDDGQWRTAPGGFGTRETPNARVFTEWSTNNIWMRKKLKFDELPTKPALLIYHDEDAQVYLNGKLIAKFDGYITEYKVVELNAESIAQLKTGENLLAVHCRQSGGGQFIDVHVIDANAVPKLPEPPPETQPTISPLITQWGSEVTAENAWTEYPRPELQRSHWTNLNGNWDYAITELAGNRPSQWSGHILVPFALESKLSGVQRLLAPNEALWYHRTFLLDQMPAGRMLLNFEAVDFECEVWVNNQSVGKHVGGNIAFSFDISTAVKAGSNEIVIKVLDATGNTQLRGKQRLDPQGIWYTRVSGIWQTVWLEEVSKTAVRDIDFKTDITTGEATVTLALDGEMQTSDLLQVIVSDGDMVVARGDANGPIAKVKVLSPKLWSPQSPHLYDVQIQIQRGGQLLDSVKSYFAFREVGKSKDAKGNWILTLNHKPIFHWGPLDQGWWPDGLLTPPSDEAMQWEINWLKEAGFNMIRKHIKVEPRRYYYHCDRLGMMVWQDQVSAIKNPKWTRFETNPEEAQWTPEEHQQFMAEFEAMIQQLDHHPAIVIWTPYNEAWGQHLTMEVGQWAVKRDPTRLINIASGGNFWPVGDIADWHQYPHPGFPFDAERFKDFVLVVGEFGGHGWPVDGHLWDPNRRNWGYGGLPQNADEYKDRFVESIRLLIELKSQGIAAGVYTQTTDVEGEINGLLTYDRKVVKIPAEELKKITAPLVEN
ncbi:MAG: hypothetical protein KDB03_09085 [Planctomycetales bacterium]|nr:hypothetical protein [Planctomycetales bacterium]